MTVRWLLAAILVPASALLAAGCIDTGGTTETPLVSPPADNSTNVAGQSKPADNYDSFLERVRAGDCSALAARVGTCGSCLVIIESHIDSYDAWYFDPDTRQLVGQHQFDPMLDVDTWTPGPPACAAEEFEETEFIVCGD
jgi:hypothetical protein